jgi:hypothetical protein
MKSPLDSQNLEIRLQIAISRLREEGKNVMSLDRLQAIIDGRPWKPPRTTLHPLDDKRQVE